MSALQFQRQIGFKRYETVFQMLHKLRAGMVRPDQYRIGAEWPVEVYETLVGGKTRGEGRGVHHKTYVVDAVEVRNKRIPRGRRNIYAGRLRLRVVGDRGKNTLQCLYRTALSLVARSSQMAGWGTMTSQRSATGTSQWFSAATPKKPRKRSR